MMYIISNMLMDCMCSCKTGFVTPRSPRMRRSLTFGPKPCRTTLESRAYFKDLMGGGGRLVKIN